MKRKVLCALTALMLCAFAVASAYGASYDDLLSALPAAPAAVTLPVVFFPEAATAGADAQSDARIALSDAGAQIAGAGAYVTEAGDVMITAAGSYLVSGALRGGKLIVDTPDDKKVELLLCGVDIQTQGQPALLVLTAAKNVTLTLLEGSVNLLSSAYTSEDTAQDGAYDAAIYSKADLKIKGTGALYIACTGGKGVNCRDDLTLSGGSVYVRADDDGLRGKDSVNIEGGYTVIEAGADGLRANNDSDDGKGNITVSGGEIYITAQGDGAQAYGTLTVSGGVLACQTGDGAGEARATSGFGGGRGGMGGKGGMGDRFGSYGGTQSASGADDGSSTKALKADGQVIISGGALSLDSADDAIHANSGVAITGGEIYIKAADDGVHGDDTLLISGGNILIAQSYEGLESADITLAGGVMRVTASDDGVNAAGGALSNTASAGMGFGRGMGMMESSGGTLTITGGYLCVNAGGDGIDSNGNITMTGGFAVVYGPTDSGNGPLDYGGTFTMTGGTLMASGSSGMAQTVANENVGELAFTCDMAADSALYIQNAAGDRVFAFASPKRYACVVLCSPDITPGATYQIYAGGTLDAQAVDGVYAGGAYTGGTLLGSLTAQ